MKYNFANTSVRRVARHARVSLAGSAETTQAPRRGGPSAREVGRRWGRGGLGVTGKSARGAPGCFGRNAPCQTVRAFQPRARERSGQLYTERDERGLVSLLCVADEQLHMRSPEEDDHGSEAVGN